MTSEIRANTIKNRVGLGTVSYTNTGVVVSGIVTANSFSGPLNSTGDITSTGNITISNTTPTLTFTDTDANPDFQIKANTGHFYFVDATNNQTRFYVSPDGATNFEGNLNANRDFSVERHTNLDNVSISGVTTFTGAITANSTLYVGSDLTITDKIVHNGDTNTAIRFPAADTIQFETSGHDRIYIKSDGFIGIGTDAPLNHLHLNSNGNNGVSFRMENYEGYSTFHNDGGALHFDSGFHIFRNQAGSTEFLRIHSNGKISTGVNNDSYEFTIGGLSGGPTLWLRDSTTSGSPRILFGSSEGALIGGITYNNSTDHFEFAANGIERFRIESVNSSRARFNFGAGNGDFTNPDKRDKTIDKVKKRGKNVLGNTLGAISNELKK